MSQVIPASNKIVQFFHCGNCVSKRPAGQSMQDWVRLEAGWTMLGLQVRCVRCDLNIIHIDFEGVRHSANTTIIDL